MRDVVIIGGGLTGLVAANELETLGIRYTLIEVKPSLGGGIQHINRAGFTMDSGPMLHQMTDFDGFIRYLEAHTPELKDQLVSVGNNLVAFKSGTGVLIDALANRIKAPLMSRMAVSTIGFMDERRHAICMENGMLLDARSLIVAAPARHAERMFHTMTPEISFKLLGYRYDTLTRISLAYKSFDASQFSMDVPQDYPIVGIQQFEHPDRGGTILQVALRIAEHDLSADPVGEIAALMGWPVNPDADHIATWGESDPLMWHDEDHTALMKVVMRLLPGGVALAGSDYIPVNHAPRLDERIQQGIQAAHRVAKWLQQA